MADPLQVGLIGAGLAAAKHLAAYTQVPQHARIVAICDTDQQAAQNAWLAWASALARASETPLSPAIYTDPLQLLREAPIDAVDICTTNPQHAALAIAAAQARKHILVEKPMATTLDDCRAMVDAAEQSGVILMVAMNQRFKPNYIAVKNAIDRGEIGPIRAIRMEATMDVVSFSPPDHWVFDARRAGGGVLMSYAVSRLDLMRFFAGPIRRVFATCRTTDPHFINGAEDQATAILEFENGAVGELFASFTSARLPHGESFTIIGQRGTIHADGSTVRQNEPAQIARSGDRFFDPIPPLRTPVRSGDGFAPAIAHFADRCRTGAQPSNSGRDSIETMKAVVAMYQSAAANARSTSDALHVPVTMSKVAGTRTISPSAPAQVLDGINGTQVRYDVPS